MTKPSEQVHLYFVVLMSGLILGLGLNHILSPGYPPFPVTQEWEDSFNFYKIFMKCYISVLVFATALFPIFCYIKGREVNDD